MPGYAPEPIAFFEHGMRLGPIDAIFGKRYARLAADEFLILINGAADGEHEVVVGSDGKFRVAEVDTRFFEERGGFPVVAVGGGEDADFAVAVDVALGFATGAKPLVVETGEVGECVVVGAGPDFFDREKSEAGGWCGLGKQAGHRECDEEVEI